MRRVGMGTHPRRSTATVMRMTTNTRMTTDMGTPTITARTTTSTDPMPRVVRSPAPLAANALLQLMWLASPALPVGGFSYSEVLEAAVDSGRVENEAQATAWLRDQLLLTLSRSELAVLAKAFLAWQRGDAEGVRALNDWVRCSRESQELRLQTEQMGRSLTEWLKNRGQPDARIATLAALAPAPTWPVAFALAGLLSGAPLREALLASAFGWAENMVQAAIKAVPLGQSAGQRMLAALVEAIPAAVDRAASLADGERQAFAPMLAILSAQHETQYSRLFRS
jgi:urease accessory protein